VAPSDATKARLLAAAEALLAERGFAGMSIRALAERAVTSVSAAHYHFGGKLGLVTAVFVARIEPINAARLARLDALVAGAAPAAPRLEDVLDTFFRPAFEAWRQGEALGRPATPHLLAQLHADPAARLEDLRRQLFEPLMDRYLDVLGGVLPEQDRDALRVGLHLAVGCMLHVVGGHLGTEGQGTEGQGTEAQGAGGRGPLDEARSPGGGCDGEVLRGRLVGFAAAGLRAGAPPAVRGAGSTR